jgi:hypothetical protein
MSLDDNLIFGNSDHDLKPDVTVEATYQNTKCNVRIVRSATREEYINYMKRMNFTIERYHGPFYYAAIGD